jgi:hypothetical protein
MNHSNYSSTPLSLHRPATSHARDRADGKSSQFSQKDGDLPISSLHPLSSLPNHSGFPDPGHDSLFHFMITIVRNLVDVRPRLLGR